MIAWLYKIKEEMETQNLTSLGGKKQWVTYILECLDGSYYTGITNNIEKRMKTHALGNGSKYVRQKGFSHLIATKSCKNRSDASKTEYFVKKLPKEKKINFIQDTNSPLKLRDVSTYSIELESFSETEYT